MLGLKPRYKVGSVYGVEIYADPALPVGSWNSGKPEARELALKIDALETFLQCHMMRIKSIDIVHSQDQS